MNPWLVAVNSNGPENEDLKNAQGIRWLFTIHFCGSWTENKLFTNRYEWWSLNQGIISFPEGEKDL